MGCQMLLRKLIVIAVLLLGCISASRGSVDAQTSSTDVDVYDVFLNRTATPGNDTFYFVSLRTGLSTLVTVDSATNVGDDALLGRGVLFRDQNGAASEAYPDGHSTSLDFIGLVPRGGTLQWTVSANHDWIAWVMSRTEAGSLLSDLYVAQADGTRKQLALHTSSSKGLGLHLLAIADDGGTIFYSRQTDLTDTGNTYPTASDIYQITIANGQFTTLPGEPRCSCAAAFSSDGHLFFRLEGTAHGFAAHFIDLAGNITQNSANTTEVRIDPPVLGGGLPTVQAGDALLSEKGNFAVYSVASGILGSKSTQYTLILADAVLRQQRVIVPPRSDQLSPIAFESNGSNALLLVNANNDGTYRLWLPDGALTQLSADTYLGTLN